jgi:hypothetical protein
MATTVDSDMVIYNDLAQTAYLERIQDKLEVFNTASNGAIVYRSEAIEGDLQKRAFYKVGGTIEHRNVNSTDPVVPKKLGSGESVAGVRVAGRHVGGGGRPCAPGARECRLCCEDDIVMKGFLSKLLGAPAPTAPMPSWPSAPAPGVAVTFDLAFERLIGHEGKFTDVRADRGNWTSGKVGVGELKGTKYGISAMSYPMLDIKSLTLAQAKAIYQRDFWDRAGADEYDGAIGYQVFDAAVNHGIENSVRFLQRAVRVADDGYIGPYTLKAVKAMSVTDVLMSFDEIQG